MEELLERMSSRELAEWGQLFNLHHDELHPETRTIDFGNGVVMDLDRHEPDDDADEDQDV